MMSAMKNNAQHGILSPVLWLWFRAGEYQPQLRLLRQTISIWQAARATLHQSRWLCHQLVQSLEQLFLSTRCSRALI
jgi:hypothetical protein